MSANRFVIMAAARTGSNLLVRSLNQPPKVRCFGEVAKPTYMHDLRAIELLSKLTDCLVEDLKRMHASDLVGFVYDQLYGIRAQACGFKFFYEHRQYPQAEMLWRRLVDDAGLRVVHLVRDNLLEMYLSLIYARRTDAWVQPSAAAETSGGNDFDDVTLDVSECTAFFEEYSRDRDRATHEFGNHPNMTVSYEQLSADPMKVVNDVRRFIGLAEVENYTPPLAKQAKRGPADKIANFHELSAHFRGSEWSRFFFDPSE